MSSVHAGAAGGGAPLLSIRDLAVSFDNRGGPRVQAVDGLSLTIYPRQTVAVVGYAAAGLGGGLLASLVAFTPSFAFVLSGAPHFAALRRNARVQAFLTGAGPAAIGAIAGSAISLGLELTQLWQVAVLGLAAIWLLALRKNVVAAIVGAAGLGVIAALVGAPLP